MCEDPSTLSALPCSPLIAYLSLRREGLFCRKVESESKTNKPTNNLQILRTSLTVEGRGDVLCFSEGAQLRSTPHHEPP